MKQIISFLILLLIATISLFAQTNPNNVPKPPTAELEKFQPFIGNWEATMDYAGLKWNGTVEFKPVVKGWYIERTILTKTTDARIDREFKALITWDAGMKQYRVWRFETVPPLQKNEMSADFKDGAFIEVMEMNDRNGGKNTFRNTWVLNGPDELKCTTEVVNSDGKVMPVGVTTAKRVLR